MFWLLEKIWKILIFYRFKRSKKLIKHYFERKKKADNLCIEEDLTKLVYTTKTQTISCNKVNNRPTYMNTTCSYIHRTCTAANHDKWQKSKNSKKICVNTEDIQFNNNNNNNIKIKQKSKIYLNKSEEINAFKADWVDELEILSII